LQASGNSSYALTAPSTGSSSQSLSVAANASITVLPWASAFDGVRKAQRGLLRAQLERRDAQNSLLINLKSQYFAARLAVWDVALAQKSEKIASQQLQNAVTQKSNGQISQENLLVAERNAQNSKANRQQAEYTAALAQLTLSGSFNTTSASWTFDTPPIVLEIPPGSLALLAEKAFAQRSDIQKARFNLQDSEENLASSQRDRWLPNASIGTGYGSRDGLSLSAGLNLQSGALSLGASYPLQSGSSGAATPASFTLNASLSLPFLAPSSDGKINSAQLSLELAKIALENTKQNALIDIQGRLGSSNNSLARLSIARLLVASNRQTLNTSRARQTAGLATSLDVLQVELSLEQSQRELEATIVTEAAAVANLNHALGETIQ
jgi:outer membrane protein